MNYIMRILLHGCDDSLHLFFPNNTIAITQNLRETRNNIKWCTNLMSNILDKRQFPAVSFLNLFCGKSKFPVSLVYSLGASHVYSMPKNVALQQNYPVVFLFHHYVYVREVPR